MILEKKPIRFFSITIISTLLFYTVKLSFLPLDFYRILYLALPFLLLFYSHTKTHIETTVLTALFMLSLVFSLLLNIIHLSTDLTFARMNLDYVLTSFFIAPIVISALRKKILLDKNFIVKIIFFSIVAQSIIMLAMLASSDIQKIIYNMVYTGSHPINLKISMLRFRAIGLTGFATYSMGVIQCFGLYIYLILINRQLSLLKFSAYVFSLLLILTSAIISARTSFIFIAPIILYMSVVIPFSRNKYLKKNTRNTLILILVIGASAILYLLSIDSASVDFVLTWIMKIFNSGLDKKSSFSTMLGMYFMPSELTLLFGDARYVNITGGYYQGTDIGYIRMVLNSGIFGTLLFLSPFVYLFSTLFVYAKKIYDLYIAIPLAIYCTLLFLVLFKGSIFFDGFTVIKFITLLTLSFMFTYRHSPEYRNSSHLERESRDTTNPLSTPKVVLDT